MNDRTMPQGLHHHQFASDNCAGVCAEAFAALEQANRGYAPGYGEDVWTKKACDLFRDLFEIDCEVFFTFNGTAANSLCVSHLAHSYHSIICHQTAHLETDECGGPEFFSNGAKVLLVGGDGGKVDPKAVHHTVTKRRDIHYPKPRVLSVTQSTELGTVYNPDELDAIAETARRHDLRVHMDGARFANAAASLNLPPKQVTWKVGVDVLCFGGTKNGMPVGDAVIFFDKQLAAEFDYRCKQAGQLASKMRFLAAPWVGMLEGGMHGAWLKHAQHANRMAARLAEGFAALGLTLLTPRHANAVFVQLPDVLLRGLPLRGWHFYTFIGAGGARFMCSWQTTEQDVDHLLADAGTLLAEATEASAR